MTELRSEPLAESAVDDVRRVREQFAQESGGDLRKHVEQTRAVFQELQVDLQLPLAGSQAGVTSDQ